MEEDYKTITEKEVKDWCTGSFGVYILERLTEIINGEYDLNEAREDIISLRSEL